MLTLRTGTDEDGPYWLACSVDSEMVFSSWEVRLQVMLQLMLFSGISSLPDPGMDEAQVHARARLARLSLDLVEATGG